MVKIFGYEILPSKKINDLQKQLDTLRYSTTRPGLDIIEKLGAEGVRMPYLPVSLRTIYDIAYYSDIIRNVVNALRQEIFREGIRVKEKFIKKCTNTDCGIEFHEKPDTDLCPECDTILRDPDVSQKEEFEKWKEDVNENNQTLEEVMKMIEDDLNIFDDAYLIFIKDYAFDDSGQLLGAKLRELIRGDPREFRIIADKTGRPGRDDSGNVVYSCLVHRTQVWTNELFCPKCNKPLYKALFQAQDLEGSDIYYMKGEVIHISKYSASLTYGFSPVLTVWQKAITLIEQDKFMKEYYVKGRPPRGLLFVRTPNIGALEKSWNWMIEKFKQNPHQIPPIPIEGGEGKKIVEFIDFMHTLQEMQFTEVRNEFRRAIGALYNVMPLFTGQVEGAGGLSNEGLQITVTARGIQVGQELYNRKIFPFLAEQKGLWDYCVEIKKAEIMDEMTLLRLETQKIQNAQGMRALGFKVSRNDDGEFEFGQEPTEEPLPTGGGYGRPDLTTPRERQRFMGEPTDVRRGEGAISTQTSGAYSPIHSRRRKLRNLFNRTLRETSKEVNKKITLKRKDIKKIDVELKEIGDALFKKIFEGLKYEESENVKDFILGHVSGDIDFSELIKKIVSTTKLNEDEAERIARTETQSLNNKMREMSYERIDPENEFKYRWVGPSDYRTTKICKAITSRTADGVSLKELKKIIKQEGTKGGFDTREYTPHINCRHTFIRSI